MIPKEASLYTLLGSLLVANKKNDDALSYFNKAIELDPNSDEAHYSLGDLYFDLRIYDKAETHLVEATKLKPTTSLYYFKLAALCQAKQDLNSALRWIHQAKLVDPKNPQVYMNHGSILAKADKTKEAEKYFKKAYQLNPNNFDCRMNLSAHYINTKQFSQAREILDNSKPTSDTEKMFIELYQSHLVEKEKEKEENEELNQIMNKLSEND